MAGSDTVSQHFERAGREDGTWDRVRSLRMGVVGLCMSGPVSQLQHVCLERAFPGVSTGAVIAKVIAGAAIAPATITLNFTGTAEGVYDAHRFCHAHCVPYHVPHPKGL